MKRDLIKLISKKKFTVGSYTVDRPIESMSSKYGYVIRPAPTIFITIHTKPQDWKSTD